jgi:hypothetical protein
MLNHRTLSPRQIAGRLNQQKRLGLTPAGRERLRQTALANRPWRFSTGPRTAAGKARAAANGRRRTTGVYSIRELRSVVADIGSVVSQMRDLRHSLTTGAGASS